MTYYDYYNYYDIVVTIMFITTIAQDIMSWRAVEYNQSYNVCSHII